MEKPSEFNIAVTEALSNLKDYFDKHSHDNVLNGNRHLFTEIVKATIIKSYQFALSLNQHDDNYMFFTLPALRGICEEYILEKFLFDEFNDEKDQIILLRHLYDHFKSSIVQWQYFEKNRADQNLYYEDNFPDKLKETENELRDLIIRKIPGLNPKAVFPSVHYMSKQTGLLELYNYLYHATSSFVHFNPNNLLRMGWGELPNIQFSDNKF